PSVRVERSSRSSEVETDPSTHVAQELKCHGGRPRGAAFGATLRTNGNFEPGQCMPIVPGNCKGLHYRLEYGEIDAVNELRRDRRRLRDIRRMGGQGTDRERAA